MPKRYVPDRNDDISKQIRFLPSLLIDTTTPKDKVASHSKPGSCTIPSVSPFIYNSHCDNISPHNSAHIPHYIPGRKSIFPQRWEERASAALRPLVIVSEQSASVSCDPYWDVERVAFVVEGELGVVGIVIHMVREIRGVEMVSGVEKYYCYGRWEKLSAMERVSMNPLH